MPEYLAPGVFVEEVSFRSKTIEGVGTTTAGFVGPTRYGPLDMLPEAITSLAEYERLFGGKAKPVLGGRETDNYMWNAVRAFFEEGGKRAYVARAFTPVSGDDDGCAKAGGAVAPLPGVRARFPGAAGNGRVTITLELERLRPTRRADGTVDLGDLAPHDLVWVRNADGALGFRLLIEDEPGHGLRLSDGNAWEDVQEVFSPRTPDVLDIRRVTARVTFEPSGGDLPFHAVTNLPLDPRHKRGGVPDSLFDYFAATQGILAQARPVPIVIDRVAGNGLDVLGGVLAMRGAAWLNDFGDEVGPCSLVIPLAGGNDGLPPTVDAYAGTDDPAAGRCSGLRAFEMLDDIAMVAAPGATEFDDPRSRAVVGQLISHAERMRHRIAIVDSVRGQSIGAVRAFRALYDSSQAAFYYPWVRILDPLTGAENSYPPSGFVAGIYARTDVERGVYKAPANEVVRLARGFETLISKGQQEVLNPEGINCFRYFPGRGMRLWGARTMSSDPEQTYVNVRRYLAYLQHSVEIGTAWAVFEPNGETLWASVRRSIGDFLLNEWRNGGLLGDKPAAAFFVRCDRSTMTRNDLDNGRLVCLIGVALVKPAEFVIWRAQQWTADKG